MGIKYVRKFVFLFFCLFVCFLWRIANVGTTYECARHYICGKSVNSAIREGDFSFHFEDDENKMMDIIFIMRLCNIRCILYTINLYSIFFQINLVQTILDFMYHCSLIRFTQTWTNINDSLKWIWILRQNANRAVERIIQKNYIGFS